VITIGEDQRMLNNGVDTMCSPKNSRRARRNGQGLVEMALLAPLLLFLLMVTIDFARAYSAYIEINNAARAGAIHGSRSSAEANNASAVRAAALADSPEIFGTTPSVSSSTQKDSAGFEQITVTVDYTFETLISFPGIPDSVDLSRSVQMRISG
jgi:Flp pilus assembly protein TadG